MCNLFSKNVKGIRVSEVNGNCPYHKKNQLLTPEEFTKKKICPVLLHTITPYYITLKNGGWFRWFKDDVIVRCPSPKCNAVLALKRDSQKKETTIKIKSIKSRCQYNHKEGDIITLGDKDFSLCPGAFNSLYPYMLLLEEGEPIPWKNSKNNFVVRCPSNSKEVIYEIITKKPIKQKKNIECPVYDDIEIKTQPLSTKQNYKCRYHLRKNHEYKYNFNSISPKNLCVDAYHMLYPYALAFIYGAKFINSKEKETVYLRCPNPNGVLIKLKREPMFPKPIMYAKKRMHHFLQNIGHPIDLPFDYKINMSIEDVGGCPKKYLKGDNYKFNLWNTKELCPASSHALFPYILLLSKNKRLKWEKSKGIGNLSCPDHEGFTYNIKHNLKK